MQRFRLVVFFAVMLALICGLGCTDEETIQEPPKSTTPSPEITVAPDDRHETVYVTVIPPTKTNPVCDIIPDPKYIKQDSQVRLSIINLSGEELYIEFGNDIADIETEKIKVDGLKDDHSWSVDLKTDKKGKFIYTVMGKGIPTGDGDETTTCLPHLPTPRIVIP